jgi:hypothetical protein
VSQTPASSRDWRLLRVCLHVPNAIRWLSKIEIRLYAFHTENRSEGKWYKYSPKNQDKIIRQGFRVFPTHAFLHHLPIILTLYRLIALRDQLIESEK